MLDERDDLACHELHVLPTQRPARMRVALVFDRQILPGAPHLAVVDPDDEERGDALLGDQVVDGFRDPPGVAGEGASGVEEILPVVQIQDRRRRCARAPSCRTKDGDAAAGAEMFALENVDVQCLSLSVTGSLPSRAPERATS